MYYIIFSSLGYKPASNTICSKDKHKNGTGVDDLMLEVNSMYSVLCVKLSINILRHWLYQVHL